ncbi:hypothetical protein VIGAN_04037300 [Vigna angularis var. angularis]|uniref:Uncharacterized protein n=1 Tax=Vigna angularis var. angularis TaxID=157739 RepID=A0A0S3RRQ1_PHAAN|nr:hypothetical protein VIGAN_04037300 [Vigna angularis var. angularis]
MKKRVMWVMVIWLYGLLSIATSSKSNGTTSLCDASVEDCLLDSWLPTISSSHFRRVLVDNLQFPTTNTAKPDETPFKSTSEGYKNGGPTRKKGPSQCPDTYSRPCHDVNSS